MYKLWSKRIKSQLKKDLLVKQSSEAAIAGVLKVSQNLLENTCARVSSSIKLQTQLQASGTGVS